MAARRFPIFRAPDLPDARFGLAAAAPPLGKSGFVM